MKKCKAAVFGFILAFVMLFASVNAFAGVDESQTYFEVESNSWPGYPAGPDISAYTGCVMDAGTGQVLYAKGMDAERYPASITKVMTAILIMDNCDMSSLVTMTEEGLADAYAGSSNIIPTYGEIFTVEECLKMILVKSANDVSTQMAVFIAGSVDAFAAMMNDRAAALGCTHTHFANASGLHNPDHYTSAHDIALIMQEALKYQKFREITSQLQVVIPATNYSEARVYDTHLEMLKEGGFHYDGTISGKTGNTDEAMSTLVMAAERNGRTLIGVIMGHGSGEGIIYDMHSILDYGFNNSFPAPVVSPTPEPEPSPEPVPEVSSASSSQSSEAASSETAAASVSETASESKASEENTPAADADGTADKKSDGSGKKKVVGAVIIILVVILALLIIGGIRASIEEKKRRARIRARREAERRRRAAEEGREYRPSVDRRRTTETSKKGSKSGQRNRR